MTCPFCGLASLSFEISNKRWRIVCNTCEAQGPPAESRGQAKAKWEHRIEYGEGLTPLRKGGEITGYFPESDYEVRGGRHE